MGLLPQFSSDWESFDIEGIPPHSLITGLMQLPMMAPAERHSAFVADFDA